MRKALAIPAAAVVLMCGCGTGGREADIRAVANDFLTAVDRRDGTSACALLTAQARQELESSAGKPCTKAVVALRVGAPPVSDVEVYITNGSALARRGRWLFLDQSGSQWRVSAAGCVPRPGDRPYDCDLKA